MHGRVLTDLASLDHRAHLCLKDTTASIFDAIASGAIKGQVKLTDLLQIPPHLNSQGKSFGPFTSYFIRVYIIKFDD